MARRKKTPDVLADPHAPTSPIVKEKAKSENTLAADPFSNVGSPVEKSFSDPLAMLFPPLADAPRSSTSTIKLTVTATEDLAQEVESAVSQAFSTLSNVQVVTGEADWTLVILSVAIQSPSRTPDGVALSIVVVESPQNQFQERRHPQANLSATASLERLRIFHGAWLRVAVRSQLPRLCRQIVTDFAERYLALDSRVRRHDASA